MRLALALALWLTLCGFVPLSGGGAASPPSSSPPPPAPTCPGSTACSLVHNAPGWLASHTYTATSPALRTNNGAAWNGSVYTPGALLRNYQLTSVGSCVSASSGGPSGTGSPITDGTCTWAYVSDTDYVSLTGWIYDGPAWTAKTYTYRDFVVSDAPLSAYTLETGALGPGGTCASTAAPTGTGTPTPGTQTSSGPSSIAANNNVITASDGCQWRWMAFVTYTSQKSFIPHQGWVYNGINHMVPGTYNLTQNYQASLYNDREYVAGSNSENAPIHFCGHTNLSSCADTGELTNSETCIGQATGGGAGCFEMIITAAPGESFRDTVTSAIALAGYDRTKGVGISDSLTWPIFGGSNEATGLLLMDQWVTLKGIQVKSANTMAIDAYNYHANYVRCEDCILDGGSVASFPAPAIAFDAGTSVLANSLVIARGPIGVFAKYDTKWLHNTIVAPANPAASLCIAQYWTGFGNPNGTTVFDTDCFGFTHFAAGLDSSQGGTGTGAFLADSDRNATNVALGDSGTVLPGFPGGSSLFDVVAPLGAHSLTSQSAASVFVSAYADMREANAAPTKAAGAAYGSFPRYCENLSCVGYPTLNEDTPDIIKTVRPGSGGTDIGAWQAP